jgi:hypothetical protein
MSVQSLLKIVALPRDPSARASWLEQHELKRWLDHERGADRVTLYGSATGRHGSSVFVQAILVPQDDLGAANEKSLISWSGNPFDHYHCGLVYGGGRPPRVELSPPGAGFEECFPRAQRLIFGRSFEARHGHRTYYELSQELTLAHELHWLDERGAWCRLNDDGDVVDLARVERIGEGRLEPETGVAVTIDRQLLELHMAATRTCLVQMFDSICVTSEFNGWTSGSGEKVFTNAENCVAFKYRVDASSGSFFRGSQVLRPPLNADELGAELYLADRAPKQYTTFITHDFKNGRLLEVSCDPTALASYFDKGSPLPFQTSPVFFKPEVLDKYKADPDKYRLADRTISCRNSWSLETYDVNEAGQVHTYITHLGNLPYQEQMYWKSFNEKPKGTISRRAFLTDFKGEFDDEPDGLRSLRNELEGIRHSRAPWFTIRESDLLDQLHYPLTASNKAWGDTLTTLAKCVVEGINKSYLVSEAKKRGSVGDPAWGSLKWLRELLTSLGVESDRVAEVVDPLSELQRLRTKLDAHAGGSEATTIRRELLREFETPRAHINGLATDLAASLGSIDSILRERGRG